MSRANLTQLFELPLEKQALPNFGKLFGAGKSIVDATKSIGSSIKAAPGWAAKNPTSAAGAGILGGGLTHWAGEAAFGENSPTHSTVAPALNAVFHGLGSITPAVRGTMAQGMANASWIPNMAANTFLGKDSPTRAGINSFYNNMLNARDAGFNDVGEHMYGAFTNNDHQGLAASGQYGNNTAAQRADVNSQLSQNDRWAGTVGDVSHAIGGAAAEGVPLAGAGTALKSLRPAATALGWAGVSAGPELVNTAFNGPIGMERPSQQVPEPAAQVPATPKPVTQAPTPTANPADQQSIAATGDVSPQTNQSAFGKLQELIGDPTKAWAMFQQLDPNSKIALTSGLALGGAGLVNHLMGGSGETSGMLGALGLGAAGAGIYNAANGGLPGQELQKWINSVTGRNPAADPADPATPTANQSQSQVEGQTAPTAGPAASPMAAVHSAVQQAMATPDPAKREQLAASMVQGLSQEHKNQIATYSAPYAIPEIMKGYTGADKTQVEQFLQQNWPKLQAIAKQSGGKATW